MNSERAFIERGLGFGEAQGAEGGSGVADVGEIVVLASMLLARMSWVGIDVILEGLNVGRGSHCKWLGCRWRKLDRRGGVAGMK